LPPRQVACVRIASEPDCAVAGIVESKLASIYTDRGVSDASSDIDRFGVVECFADELDQRSFQFLRIFEIIRVPLLLVYSQAWPGMRMHGTEEKLAGLELELIQDDLAEMIGGPAVEADQVGRDQNEPLGVVLEHDDSREQRIVNAFG
jgi:hypothetical protein